jgi:hypothetical protein
MEVTHMNAFRSIYRTVRSFLPSEKKARRAIARHFAASVTRKAPRSDAPGLWPWGVGFA